MVPSSIASTSSEVLTVTSRSVPVTRIVLPVTSAYALEDRQRRPGSDRPAGPAQHIGEIVSLSSDTHRLSLPLYLLFV